MVNTPLASGGHGNTDLITGERVYAPAGCPQGFGPASLPLSSSVVKDGLKGVLEHYATCLSAEEVH